MEVATVNLLCVVGATPAVVTETIYGLVTRDTPVAIESLYVVTTTVGREELGAGLKEQLDAMRAEYPSISDRLPTFTADSIRVPLSEEGREIEDLRTVEHGAAMTDLIWRLVRRLSEDGMPRLHASLAGGRKTMSFMLGYAMILFARRGDRLSHVLVSKDAEACGAFYFPTRESKLLETYSGTEFDASKERIELHEVEFIRLRGRLDRLDEVSHVELVRHVQEQVDRDLILSVDLTDGEILLGTEHIRLEPATRAVFAALATAHVDGETPINAQGLLRKYAKVMDAVHEAAGDEDKAFFTLFALQPAALDQESDKYAPSELRRAKQNIRQHLSVIRTLINSEAYAVLPQGGQRGYTLSIPVERVRVCRGLCE